MRFMMFIHSDARSEAGVLPTAEELSAMTAFNQQMLDQGVMLQGEALHPTSDGVRVRIKDGTPSVTDGPFTETKEIIAGYWMIQVNSKEEAVGWAKRVPLMGEETVIELRQVYGADEFPEDVQAATQ